MSILEKCNGTEWKGTKQNGTKRNKRNISQKRNGTKRNGFKRNGTKRNVEDIVQKRKATKRNGLERNGIKRNKVYILQKRNESEKMTQTTLRIYFILFRSVLFRSVSESKIVGHLCTTGISCGSMVKNTINWPNLFLKTVTHTNHGIEKVKD